jgi:transmembrane sensor
MYHWDQIAFEELISDDQFINWVRGDEVSNIDYWKNWKNTHPSQIDEFNQAVKTVKALNFNPHEINQADIRYLWAKTSEKINHPKPEVRFHRILHPLLRVAAILTLPLFLISSWLYFNQNNLEKKYTSLLENKTEQKVTVLAPIGARIVVDLPDGSKVWLNSGSELSYPIIFNTNERHVCLTGEAYFKVQKEEIPFFVSSLGPEIKVYGTEFNVNSYSDEENVTVALIDGKISLELKDKEQFLAPGQISTFNKEKNDISIEHGDVNNFCSWRDGKYIFRNTPLSAILRILQRQHNVSIHLLNTELGNYRYNATIHNESLEQILQLLSMSAPIKYTFKRREMRSNGTYVPDNIEISDDKTRIIKN